MKEGMEIVKEFTVEAKIPNIPAVVSVVDDWLEGLSCPIKAQMQIDVAVDELFSNISRYAYAPEKGEVTIQMEYDEKSGMASVTFIDKGIPFNPLQKEEPDISLPAEERGIGGLGIFLVRKTMDKMEYRHEAGSNMLTIYKKIKEGIRE